MKKQGITIGAILEINIENKYYTYAQILHEGCGFFGYRSKEHSVDSFTQQEILNYVPEGDRTKGGKCDTWEQKGRK